MTPDETVVEGTILPDGTLVLDEATRLPAGRVQVRVQPLEPGPPGNPFWEMMQSIWEGQRARGFEPRSTELVEAERREAQERWDERLRAIDDVQRESQRLRGLRS